MTKINKGSIYYSYGKKFSAKKYYVIDNFSVRIVTKGKHISIPRCKNVATTGNSASIIKTVVESKFAL